MSEQHKWCAFAKQYLFSGNGLAVENKLKENVIYRRSYTLRPTVKLEEKSSKGSDKRQTNINYHKEANNMCIETTNATPIRAHLSPHVCPSSGFTTESTSGNAKSTNDMKPVINAKPRAINNVMDREVDRSEGKAPDVWHRNARSASMPAIAVRINREDKTQSNNTCDDCTDKECRDVMMDQIRRRVSQIIESDVLAVKQSQDSDQRKKWKESHKIKEKYKIKEPKEISRRMRQQNEESDKSNKNLEEYLEVKPMNKHRVRDKVRTRRYSFDDRSRTEDKDQTQTLEFQTYDWNLNDFKSNDGLSDYLSEKIKSLSTYESCEDSDDRMARIAKRIRLRYLNILAKDSFG